jgi:hypothetical protein
VLVLLGSFCAMAQDSARYRDFAQNGPRPAWPDRELLSCMASRARGLCASEGGIGPGLRLIQWDFEVGPPAAARRFMNPQNYESVELAGRRSRVCSVGLLEMPIPRDKKFTMRVVPVRETGDRIYARFPAPACP